MLGPVPLSKNLSPAHGYVLPPRNVIIDRYNEVRCGKMFWVAEKRTSDTCNHDDVYISAP